MNWKEINKKYPEVLNKCYEWGWDKHQAYPEELYNRELYDFFDEQGIRGFVYYAEGTGKWKPEIRIKQKGTWKMKRVGFIKTENSRKEAEEVVFDKEFEILEQKLNNQ